LLRATFDKQNKYMRQLKITQQITHRNEESIGRYLQEISRFGMISAEEEVELSMRIRNGDTRALEKLIVSNLRFVISVAKQYQNQGLSFPDLINEGNLGLVKAAKKFDETRGFKFISYAVWWIRQSIFQAISEQTRVVRLPLNRLTSINKIKRAIPYLEQEFEREPTDAEIAGYLDLTNDEVKLANDIKKQQVSFDKPVSPDGENEYSLYDFVQTENIPSPDNNLMQESTVTNINRALNKLPRTEATVLIMAFGLCGSPLCSMNEIALQYDMTSERIRQIRNNGLIKLKNLLKGSSNFFEY
jgi:RNA polymerase primary sigma factor